MGLFSSDGDQSAGKRRQTGTKQATVPLVCALAAKRGRQRSGCVSSAFTLLSQTTHLA